MIAKWFNEDIENILHHHNRVVVTDAAGEGAFLIKCLPKDYIVLNAKDKLSEIEAKYTAEKVYPEKKVVFYTPIKREKLTFLLEYAETCGIVELNNMEFYLKDKIYSISASIGIALINNTENTIEGTLKKADVALYEAKARGKNQVVLFEKE